MKRYLKIILPASISTGAYSSKMSCQPGFPNGGVLGEIRPNSTLGIKPDFISLTTSRLIARPMDREPTVKTPSACCDFRLRNGAARPVWPFNPSPKSPAATRPPSASSIRRSRFDSQRNKRSYFPCDRNFRATTRNVNYVSGANGNQELSDQPARGSEIEQNTDENEVKGLTSFKL